METCSPNVFDCLNSESLQQKSNSSNGKAQASGAQIVPSQNKENEYGTFMLDVCHDSLELPRTKSRLVEFFQMRDGEDKPRQVMVPLFFHRKKAGLHERRASFKPVLAAKHSTISELLLDLREKPKQKGSLKYMEKKKPLKNVSFSKKIQFSTPESRKYAVICHETNKTIKENIGKHRKNSDIPTTPSSLIDRSLIKSEKVPDTSASTQQNLDFHDSSPDLNKNSITFEVFPKFKFEEKIRISLSKQEAEFNEFSTVAFCGKCENEVVTAVGFEKVKGEGCSGLAEWVLCWAFPACLYKTKKLVHKCPNCGGEIAKLDW